MSVAPGLPLLLVLLVLATTDPQPAGEVWQSPLYTVTPEGGSINITCSVRVDGTLLGVHLRQSYLPEMRKVTYYDDTSAPTVDARFEGRVVFSGTTDNLTITIQRLRPEDTGAYFCEAIAEDGQGWGSGTTVVVTEPNACPGTQLTRFTFLVALALALGCLLVVLGLAAMCLLKRRQIRNMCSARDRTATCVIYEDMSSHQNTIPIANHYQ